MMKKMTVSGWEEEKKKRERERDSNSNSKTLVLKDSSVRSIWT